MAFIVFEEGAGLNSFWNAIVADHYDRDERGAIAVDKTVNGRPAARVTDECAQELADAGYGEYYPDGADSDDADSDADDGDDGEADDSGDNADE